LIVPSVLNQISRIRLDTTSSRRAINTLVALCAELPVSSGIPFRTIRTYATFVPRNTPATSALIRDKAMKIIGITNIKQKKSKFWRLKASSKLSFLKKSSFRELLRKCVKKTREINPTRAPPSTSSMKCLPRYTLEKAMAIITKGVNILMILLLKTVTVPPHSAVVSATCPEGKPKGERVKAS
jgi:hypothetical protein